MGLSSHNFGTAYLFARLHGMWGHAVQGELLEGLIDCASEANFLKQLTQLGILFEEGHCFQRSMKAREMAIYLSVRNQVEASMGAYYDRVMENLANENLRVLLGARFFPERNFNLEERLVLSADFNGIDVKALVSTGTTEDFIARLPLRYHDSDFQAIIRRLDRDRDMMNADCALDRKYAQGKLEAVRTLPSSCREEAEGLVRYEIDVMNISMLMRNISFYHFSDETMHGFWISGGSLSAPVLTVLNSLPNVAQLAGRLPARFERLLGSVRNGELRESEHVMWCGLWQLCRRLFRDANHPEGAELAFPYLLRFETLNLVRIYEGLRFALSADEIRRMMICEPGMNNE